MVYNPDQIISVYNKLRNKYEKKDISSIEMFTDIQILLSIIEQYMESDYIEDKDLKKLLQKVNPL